MFIKCSCHSHGIEIEKGDILENEWFLSMWFHGRFQRIMKWRERIRWIWRIIRTGNPWADETILNYEQLVQLRDYLIKETAQFELTFLAKKDII